MVDRLADDLYKTLDDKDAVTLFQYHWNNGNRELMCQALADANISIDIANMPGEIDLLNKKFRLEHAVDKYNYKEIYTTLKELRDGGFNFDTVVPKLHGLIAKIATSCNDYTLDIIKLLIDNSEIAYKQTGMMLPLQASVNCVDGVKLLLNQPKVTVNDVNRALTYAVEENSKKDTDYSNVIDLLLKDPGIKQQTVAQLLKMSNIDETSRQKLRNF